MKQLHQKLLPKLAAFRGFWEVLLFLESMPFCRKDTRLQVALRESRWVFKRGWARQ